MGGGLSLSVQAVDHDQPSRDRRRHAHPGTTTTYYYYPLTTRRPARPACVRGKEEEGADLLRACLPPACVAGWLVGWLSGAQERGEGRGGVGVGLPTCLPGAGGHAEGWLWVWLAVCVQDFKMYRARVLCSDEVTDLALITGNRKLQGPGTRGGGLPWLLLLLPAGGVSVQDEAFWDEDLYVIEFQVPPTAGPGGRQGKAWTPSSLTGWVGGHV